MEIVLPGAATALCFALAWQMLRRFATGHRAHEFVWGAAFLTFGLGAGAESYAGLFEWTPALVRLFYLTGASLGVGFLGLGTLMLLVPRPIARVAMGVVLVQSAFMAFLVLRTPVDPDAARALGWAALPRDASVRSLGLTINVLGSMTVLIGTFGSAYSQWGAGNGSRALGVLLIGLGTLTVASGASLTRFGHHYLYGPMVIGLLLIFAGYRRVTAPAGRRIVTDTDESAVPDTDVETADARIEREQTEMTARRHRPERSE